jgi:hypothetical protein
LVVCENSTLANPVRLKGPNSTAWLEAQAIEAAAASKACPATRAKPRFTYKLAAAESGWGIFAFLVVQKDAMGAFALSCTKSTAKILNAWTVKALSYDKAMIACRQRIFDSCFP